MPWTVTRVLSLHISFSQTCGDSTDTFQVKEILALNRSTEVEFTDGNKEKETPAIDILEMESFMRPMN